MRPDRAKVFEPSAAEVPHVHFGLGYVIMRQRHLGRRLHAPWTHYSDRLQLEIDGEKVNYCPRWVCFLKCGGNSAFELREVAELILLRHSTQRVFRVSMRAQCGQRGSVFASAIINRLCSVAIEFGT
jgi:hypothetical protein